MIWPISSWLETKNGLWNGARKWQGHARSLYPERFRFISSTKQFFRQRLQQKRLPELKRLPEESSSGMTSTIGTG
jgi:hypothetical protein